MARRASVQRVRFDAATGFLTWVREPRRPAGVTPAGWGQLSVKERSALRRRFAKLAKAAVGSHDIRLLCPIPSAITTLPNDIGTRIVAWLARDALWKACKHQVLYDRWWRRVPYPLAYHPRGCTCEEDKFVKAWAALRCTCRAMTRFGNICEGEGDYAGMIDIAVMHLCETLKKDLGWLKSLGLR